MKKYLLKIWEWIKKTCQKVVDWLDNLLEPKPIIKKRGRPRKKK
jgi:hypothetical protein|tara:strand:+ start:98 stop:229 length:132 start_codon:yes stop_codon:yes gene_type:complete